MKFFTNPYGPWLYHLIPYRIWKKGYKKDYDILIIDAGVNDLISKKDYKYINEYPLKTTGNVYWVIPDYPYDVGPDLTQWECIKKTWDNIIKWVHYENVICSVQYGFENFNDFKYNYEKLYPIAERLGIGNLCKSTKMTFLKRVINYIIQHNDDNKWIHFFGLCKPGIKYLLSRKPIFEVTVDSMKWDYGMHCNREVGTYANTKEGRWEKFHDYVNDIDKWERFYDKQRSIRGI